MKYKTPEADRQLELQMQIGERTKKENNQTASKQYATNQTHKAYQTEQTGHRIRETDNVKCVLSPCIRKTVQIKGKVTTLASIFKPRARVRE